MIILVLSDFMSLPADDNYLKLGVHSPTRSAPSPPPRQTLGLIVLKQKKKKKRREKSSRQSKTLNTATRWTSPVSFVRISERNVTKFKLQTALQSIARCKLTFLNEVYSNVWIRGRNSPMAERGPAPCTISPEIVELDLFASRWAPHEMH